MFLERKIIIINNNKKAITELWKVWFLKSRKKQQSRFDILAYQSPLCLANLSNPFVFV